MSSLVGTIIGLLIGFLIDALIAVVVSVLAVPLVGSFVSLVGPLVVGMSVNQVLALAAILSLVAYLLAYMVATSAVAAALSPPPGGVLPDSAAELGARAFMTGLTAALNFGLLFLLLPVCLAGSSPGLFCSALTVVLVAVPVWFLPTIPFVVATIHLLCGFPAISRNAFFQVFVGWVSWIAPMSYIATGVGFVLFLINLPFALVQFGIAAFRIDFRTGTIETTGGLVAAASRAIVGYPGPATAVGAFSLGKFNFVVQATAGPSTGLASQSAFVGGTISAHEIGHTLNTSAMGGVVLWINAIDENVLPFNRGALAYGELLAESHSMQVARNAVRIWS